MLKVGLTGGIACGKTTILAMFEALGAHTLRADEVAHQLMLPGQSVYAKIVAAFGREILAPDTTIVRPKLAALAFPDRIAELNAIVHPAVLAYEDEWMQQLAERDPHGVALLEAALLIEAGGHKRLDKLIVVTCSLEQKIERFSQRTGLSKEAARDEVLRRQKAQMPDEEKVALADFVIDNSGTKEDAQMQVERVWRELKSSAASAD